VCRLWRGLAEDNGWRLPTDAGGGLDGGAVAEAKQRVTAKLHGLLVGVSAPTPEQTSSAEVRSVVIAPRRCDATQAASANERERRIGRGSGMEAAGVWKEWYVGTMMERVLTGKRERRTRPQRTSAESRHGDGDGDGNGGDELDLEAKRKAQWHVDQKASDTKLRIVLVTTTDRGEVPTSSLVCVSSACGGLTRSGRGRS
jgi:hypothetical protein